jgi:hypothetical protein
MAKQRDVDMRPYWAIEFTHKGRTLYVHPVDDGGQIHLDENDVVVGRFRVLPIGSLR